MYAHKKNEYAAHFKISSNSITKAIGSLLLVSGLLLL